MQCWFTVETNIENDGAALLGLDVDRQTFLVAIEAQEVAALAIHLRGLERARFVARFCTTSAAYSASKVQFLLNF